MENAGLKTLIRVERQRIVCRKDTAQNTSVQIAYFISNMEMQKKGQALELFEAMRGHWQVETANNERDCIFKKDEVKCKFSGVNQATALCKTLAIELLKKNKGKTRWKS